MDVGKMTITEAYPYLSHIANLYGFRLNRLNEFRMVRLIFVNLYNRELN